MVNTEAALGTGVDILHKELCLQNLGPRSMLIEIMSERDKDMAITLDSNT